MSNIKYKKFADINLRDSFFDSLREDYPEFDTWYQKKAKAEESAYVLYEENKLVCFVYLKIENSLDTNIIPPLYPTRWVKIGTFKIEARRTKLGQRFIKRAFDFAISHNIFDLYVTAYDKHIVLIDILKRYGFVEYGKKGNEKVLTKHIISNNDLLTFSEVCGKLEQCPLLSKKFNNLPISQKNVISRYRQDLNFQLCCSKCDHFFHFYKSLELPDDLSFIFPTVSTRETKKYILSIYPEYHTRMFSDSKLHTESDSILCDISESNSIHKVYLSAISDTQFLKRGDLLVIYRTKDKDAPSANYSSVATSLCVVEEYRSIYSFEDEENFIKYCSPYNIFSTKELKHYYETKRYPHIIKMTYNISFNKRVVLDKLRKIIPNVSYWGFVALDIQQFYQIIQEAEINDSIVVY
ncbi:hypothetical protein CQA57_00590 [Helicobacter anseris]|uniref:N-acetyltransferase n=1 Tax=Helicobacter anseris TaxID=375926 RepID=A0A3D8JB92_9HELI|nr:GNAT family N-acetyltransferase [Helicobacter anseris]RDU74580.1 hypothetical protein CQA57_00590 [Helicobacter anseris]